MSDELLTVPTIRDIQVAVAGEFGVSVLDLVSDRRSADLVRPRWVAMWLSRHTTRHSYSAIGRHFGDRDHATVIAAIQGIEKRIRSDSSLAQRCDDLLRDLTVPNDGRLS